MGHNFLSHSRVFHIQRFAVNGLLDMCSWQWNRNRHTHSQQMSTSLPGFGGSKHLLHPTQTFLNTRCWTVFHHLIFHWLHWLSIIAPSFPLHFLYGHLYMMFWKKLYSSVGRACDPCTEGLTLLQQPRAQVQPVAICCMSPPLSHPHFLSSLKLIKKEVD